MRTFVHDSSGPRIVFGPGALAGVADEVSRLGGSRAFVLSTPGRRDLADRVVEVLGDSVTGTFDGATMHTPVEVTERAMKEATAVGADALVSIGGGSTTGLGKAIAVRTGLPHLVLPTTYAGSEVTPVLGETADGEKTTRSGPEIVPDTVVYDIELTTTLPWDVTVTSSMNAMAHAVEALYAAERTPTSDDTATEALSELATGLHLLQQEPDSLDARDHLLFGAWRAGICLATVGMGLHHKLCHTLGGTFGLPHAPTHTVVLPHVMKFNQSAAPAAIATAGAADAANACTQGGAMTFRVPRCNIRLTWRFETMVQQQQPREHVFGRRQERPHARDATSFHRKCGRGRDSSAVSPTAEESARQNNRQTR